MKSSKKKIPWSVIITIITLLLVIGGTSYFAYQYIKDKDRKIVQNAEEIAKRNAEITDIRNQNQDALKDYQTDVEFLSKMTYDELLPNLVDTSLIKEKTNITIMVNGVELMSEDTLDFNEVKQYEIEVQLLYSYFYEDEGNTKEEQIKNSKETIINVVDTIKPVITGVKDKTITAGDKLDILNGISASDEKEGNLEVKYEGEVNTTKAGTYKVVIYAVDKNGNRTEQTMTITVKAKPVETKPNTSTTKPSTGTTTTPNTGSTTKPSTGSTTTKPSTSTTPTCDVTNAVLQKRGYKPTQDKDACKKNKEATEIAKKIAEEVLAKGYKTDLEKVDAAAKIVSEYYQKGVHVESGFDYRTPYGVFIKGEASCAGCTRALIQVLELMGFKNLTHANENGWTHQWVILEMDGQKGFAEAQLGFAGYGCHMSDESPECVNGESN